MCTRVLVLAFLPFGVTTHAEDTYGELRWGAVRAKPIAAGISPATGTLLPKRMPRTGLSAAVVCLAVLLSCGAWPASAQGTNVCDRTLEVQNAIVAASGDTACAQLDDRNLRDIVALDLSDRSIETLRAGDFDGLHAVESLDLSGNLLTSLPSGIFDDLYLLKSLHLDGNRLATLETDVFDQLFLLEELTLDDNSFTDLPQDLFDEFSRFDGMKENGDAPDNSGDYPRIKRFLSRHDVTSPEEFIAALPDLYRERFVLMYDSKAAAAAHVSADHPRVISWGADGNFIFAWNTDPDAPAEFRDSVEFLRQNDLDWTAGIIDFSGADTEIEEPTSCASCHGALNKPQWGVYAEWEGSEYDYVLDRKAHMEAVLEMTDARIEPLEFPDAGFRYGDKSTRYLVSPHGQPVMA
ncbi:MAG: leucine-rich repeat domain-containing protein, partial [Rhodospirillaceae bacterium]|nr:leucine-rich repeat domain-containing protein [Rhodospirillaceae bacterium]